MIDHKLRQLVSSQVSNISIKKKIIYSFLLILVIIIGQALISGNFMLQMDNSYDMNADLGTINEISLQIQQQQTDEEKFVKEWTSGVETSVSDSFDDLANGIEKSLDG